MTTTTPTAATARVNGATPGDLRPDPRPRPPRRQRERGQARGDGSRPAERDPSREVLHDGSAGPPSGRRLVLTPASAITPLPVVWAWVDDGHGRVPAGALTVAAGREGTGKSSFGIWLAAHVTRGTLTGAWHGKPRAVIYVAVEDSWAHTLVPRLIAAGADMDRVYQVEVYTEELDACTLSLPVDNRLLEHAIGEYGVGLVVLDPLMSVIGDTIDTHRERETRKALDPLARLADRTGAVVLGIAHFSKAAGTDASTLITGSGAFKNVPRAVFGFATDPLDGAAVITQTKNSLGRADLPSLAYRIDTATIPTPGGDAEVGQFVMLGPSDRSVADILADAGTPDQAEARRDAKQWLRSYLLDNGGSAYPEDVLKAGGKVGFSTDTLQRVKPRAGVVSRKEGFDAGWTWVLADLVEGREGSEEREGRGSLANRNLRATFADQPLPDLAEGRAKNAGP